MTNDPNANNDDPDPRHQRRRERVEEAIRLAAKPHDWPEIDEESFVITVDVETAEEEEGRPYLVLRVGEREIYRRPTWYENGDHLIVVCRDMREAYKGRVRNLVLAPGVEYAVVMDDWRGFAKIKKAFRPLRKDFEKARIREKREQSQD